MVGLLACDFLAALAGASVGVVQPVPVIGIIITCLDQGHHRITEGVAHGVGFHAVNGHVPQRCVRVRLDTHGQQDCQPGQQKKADRACGQEGVVPQGSHCDSCQREYSSAKKGKVSRAIGTIRMISADKSK